MECRAASHHVTKLYHSSSLSNCSVSWTSPNRSSFNIAGPFTIITPSFKFAWTSMFTADRSVLKSLDETVAFSALECHSMRHLFLYPSLVCLNNAVFYTCKCVFVCACQPTYAHLLKLIQDAKSKCMSGRTHVNLHFGEFWWFKSPLVYWWYQDNSGVSIHDAASYWFLPFPVCRFTIEV